ncbi:MAG: hypothetical protein HUJ26_21090 [Planctomycetaceae bacterium]|nr:hypothetical protein [Planctomycetaceae bacterium]
MTLRIIICSAACVLGFAVQAHQVRAQPPFGRPGTPTIPPALDLLQRGPNRGTAFNYYRRYRPSIELRQNEQQLNRSIQELRSDVNERFQSIQQQKRTSYLGTTGHSTSFHNLGGYFRSR